MALTDDDRTTLEQWSRRRTTAQALALRARIVLLAATGRSNTEVARAVHVSMPTVGKWRSRFVRDGVQGLLDEPRPGMPRQISDAQVEAVITRTLESTPRDATHWSTRSMAKAAALSQSAISRIWRAFALQPHRVETFKLSKDPLFIDKVRDIVGLYLHPPDRALVLCVDEKSQIQALDRTAPILPLRPGVLRHNLVTVVGEVPGSYRWGRRRARRGMRWASSRSVRETGTKTAAWRGPAHGAIPGGRACSLSDAGVGGQAARRS